jgi:hypothetical protein
MRRLLPLAQQSENMRAFCSVQVVERRRRAHFARCEHNGDFSISCGQHDRSHSTDDWKSDCLSHVAEFNPAILRIPGMVPRQEMECIEIGNVRCVAQSAE